MKKWDEKDVNYLKENYSSMTNNELSKFLKKSNKSINFMAWKLKLKKNRETLCRSKKHTSIEVSKELLERLYVNEGKSIRKIATILNLGKNTVDHYLKKFNISKRDTSEANKNFYKRGGKIWKTGLTKETDERILLATLKMKKTCEVKRLNKLKEKEDEIGENLCGAINRLYWKESMTQEKISTKLGIDRGLVIELMKKFDISRRPNFEYISSLKKEKHSHYGKTWEDLFGVEEAKRFRKVMSIASRRNMIKRLKNNEMPFSNTSIERAMFAELTKRKIPFIFQYGIGDKFVCDFAIPKYKVIIECDGDYWHANPKFYNKNDLDIRQNNNVKRDKYKDEYLKIKGWVVLRFFESEIINNIEECSAIISEQIRKVVNPLDSLGI